MTAAEQEALFEKVRRHFPREPQQWHSGYVHGINDAYKPDIVERFADQWNSRYAPSHQVHYSMGYIAGAIDAYGEDLCPNHETFMDMNYRWWERPHAD